MEIGRLALTLALGILGGLLFMKLKVPGGMMVGAMTVIAVLGVTADMAYMPVEARTLAQMVAGAFIAVGMDKNDLLHMRHIPKPILILVGGMLVLNMTMGTIVYAVSDLDLVTALYSCVPGGVSDIPIIADTAGANSGTVALAQLARMITGIGVFPALIAKVAKSESPKVVKEAYDKAPEPEHTKKNIAFTLLVAVAFGLLGRLSGLPAGTMLFALIGVLALKLIWNRAWLPIYIRRGAQVLSGCYIGSSITRADVLGFGRLIVPILLILMGYVVACFGIGALLKRFAGMTRREGMLAALPAGASDIALISSDLGVTSPDLIVLQIVRMLSSVVIFPQLINLILHQMS